MLPAPDDVRHNKGVRDKTLFDLTSNATTSNREQAAETSAPAGMYFCSGFLASWRPDAGAHAALADRLPLFLGHPQVQVGQPRRRSLQDCVFAGQQALVWPRTPTRHPTQRPSQSCRPAIAIASLTAAEAPAECTHLQANFPDDSIVSQLRPWPLQDSAHCRIVPHATAGRLLDGPEYLPVHAHSQQQAQPLHQSVLNVGAP